MAMVLHQIDDDVKERPSVLHLVQGLGHRRQLVVDDLFRVLVEHDGLDVNTPEVGKVISLFLRQFLNFICRHALAPIEAMTMSTSTGLIFESIPAIHNIELGLEYMTLEQLKPMIEVKVHNEWVVLYGIASYTDPGVPRISQSKSLVDTARHEAHQRIPMVVGGGEGNKQ
jgi:hypothetical protein